MGTGALDIDGAAVAVFCSRHGIRRLLVFGSAARGDLRPDSDVDILVEFKPGVAVGFHFITMQEELSELLGRRVDLVTPGFLGPHIRRRVLEEAIPVYEAS